LKKILIIILSLTFVSGCSPSYNSNNPVAQEFPIDYQSIYIVNHGWHTGIVYPRKKLLELIPDLTDRFPSGDYLEIGWGNKDFYQAKEITVGLTLRAILWPSDSVVHLVSVPHNPYTSFPNSDIRSICLTQIQFESLGRFLVRSFLRDKGENIIATRQGIYGDSQFYVGAGRYHLFNTCNSWTATGLQNAGLNIDPTLKLTASSVINYIDTDEDLNHAHCNSYLNTTNP